jgi:hypothetical protein
MYGLIWYIKGCLLLWRCCHGGGSYKEVTALRERRKSFPMTSVASASALNRVLVAAWTTIKNREAQIAPHVRRRAKPCNVAGSKGGNK